MTKGAKEREEERREEKQERRTLWKTNKYDNVCKLFRT